MGLVHGKHLPQYLALRKSSFTVAAILLLATIVAAKPRASLCTFMDMRVCTCRCVHRRPHGAVWSCAGVQPVCMLWW